MFSALVVRADIMGGLGVFAAQVERRQVGLTCLVFVAEGETTRWPDLPAQEGLQGRTLLCTNRNGKIEMNHVRWLGLALQSF